MTSNYETVNTLIQDLMELMIDKSKIDPRLYNVHIHPMVNMDSLILRYRSLAKHFNYEVGSGRLVIILKDEGIVVKFPYNEGGYNQNLREWEYANSDGITDVIETHTLFNKEHFVLVNPYYTPVLEHFDNLISEITKDIPEYTALTDVFSYENLDNWYQMYEGVNHDMLEYAVYLVADLIDGDEPVEDVNNEFWENFDDYAFAQHLADNFSGFIDTNCENFGVTDDNTYILLDAGLQSHADLHAIFEEENSEDYLVDDFIKECLVNNF